MVDIESIADALRDMVEAMPAVRHATRERLTPSTVPEYPVGMVLLDGASAEPEHGRPSRWRVSFDIGFIDRADGSEVSPEGKLNAFLADLDSALSADITLGGLCDHAWINGDIEYSPADPSNPIAMIWVAVEVLAIG